MGLGRKGAHAFLQTVPTQPGTRANLRQRAALLGYQLVTYPDAEVGWLAGRGELRRLLRSGRFDAVLSSAPPFTTNIMLGSLGPRLPWIADFRDLWTDSDYGTRFRFGDALLEGWSLRRAAALTTVSEPLARALRERHPGKRVDVIPNAFNAQDWRSVPFDREERCTILYAGALYHGRRDPRPLFRAIRELLDEGLLLAREITVVFYSTREPWLDRAISEHGLGDIVRVCGTTSREKVLVAERRADRLLVLLWDGSGADGILTGKFFEYLGARRRIIVVGGPSSTAIDGLLDQTGAGVRCTTDAMLRDELLAAVQEHRSAPRVLDERPIAPFEAAQLARRFATLLDAVVPLQRE
jgi:hypothetical protein